jgi:hypothetical protein
VGLFIFLGGCDSLGFEVPGVLLDWKIRYLGTPYNYSNLTPLRQVLTNSGICRWFLAPAHFFMFASVSPKFGLMCA